VRAQKIGFDGWALDPESGDLEREGNRIRLQEQPLQALLELIAAGGGLVTREQLIAKLWPQGVVDFDTGLNTVIRKLRAALRDTADTPRYIETLPRRGYRFIAALDAQPEAPVVELVQPLADVRGASQPQERPQRSQAPPETVSWPSGTEPVNTSSATAPVTAIATAPVAAESGENALGARPSRTSLRKQTWVSLGVLLLSIVGTLIWLGLRKADSAGNPLANAKFSHLAGFQGVGRAAAISRDGKFVAFLGNREGRNDVWVSEVGSGTYLNLTRGEPREFHNNPVIRTLDFSADSSLVTIWARSSDGSRPEDVNILAVPTHGGPLRVYLPQVAEYDWSRDGKKLVFHTTAPGDPMFVREPGKTDRLIYLAPAGVHCHFPVWSPDDAFIYFVRGIPSDGVWDIWRIRPSGTGLERLTTHNSNVAYPTLLDRRTMVYLATSGDGSGPWLYTLDTERRVPRRISFGLETYTSLGASLDGKRLVATVANQGSSLWRLTLPAKEVGPAIAPAPALISADGASPRLGPDYLL
jgi:DNA-binding winged helix-turn-helix (wHTH) protein